MPEEEAHEGECDHPEMAFSVGVTWHGEVYVQSNVENDQMFTALEEIIDQMRAGKAVLMESE